MAKGLKMWIKKYPDQEGLFWVTLNWGNVSSVELGKVIKINDGFIVTSIGTILYQDDILAVWSEPVIAPLMYKDA